MSSDGSVAPKERINVVYKSHVGDKTEEVELPLKLLMIGDYTGREDDAVIEDRVPINIHKDNFNDVMKSYNLNLDIAVENKLDDKEGDELSASLKFENIKDFAPESIASQVPELKSLMELRKALLALKGPLGNVPSFRKTIQNIVTDDVSRSKIMQELGAE